VACDRSNDTDVITNAQHVETRVLLHGARALTDSLADGHS